ncbi:MAG: polynucleotide adenylyltransferase [Acidobacteriota bacterium]
MVSKSIIKLCEAIARAGGRALLVGGWVRDHVRQVPHGYDYDLEVYHLSATGLRSLLAAHGSVNAVGEAFTVFKLRLTTPDEETADIVVDVSLPRRESKVGRGHRGFVIVGDPSMTFEEASRRRDFTINAIMFDPLTGECIDPHDGIEDIKRRRLRAVDPETFIDDSLRVLRAMQFAARFVYEIEPATVSLCRSIDLTDLPAERIWREVEKWLLAERPSIGLWRARELGIINQLWPEINALIDCPQDAEWHPEGDVFIHTGMVLDEARRLIDDLSRPRQLAIMLGALCHDFGKPSTTRLEEGRVRARGHDLAGVPSTAAFLNRLLVNTIEGYDVRSQTLSLVRHHLAPVHYYRAHLDGTTVTDGTFRRLAREVEPDLLYRVALGDCLGRVGDFKPEAEEWFIARVRELQITERAPEPLLKGRHLLELGMTPGPRVGEVARAVYELQLDGDVTGLDDAIEVARGILSK